MVIIGGLEAGVAIAEGVLERVVQHRRAHVEEGLHRGPVPKHLLLFVHALGDDLAWFETGSHAKPCWRCRDG